MCVRPITYYTINYIEAEAIFRSIALRKMESRTLGQWKFEFCRNGWKLPTNLPIKPNSGRSLKKEGNLGVYKNGVIEMCKRSG